MPDPEMAQFTTVFRATGDAQRRRPKRNRQAVSCTGCQKRKSRCDRRQPCSGCERRGEACRFGPSPSQSAAAAATGDNAVATAATSGSRRSRDSLPGPRGEVQSRLDRLEDMVRAFAEGRKRQAGKVSEKRHDKASASGAEDAGKGRRKGKGEKDGDESRQGGEEEYHEAASWTTLVENIQDIKSALRNEDAKYAHVNGGVVNPSLDQNGAAPPLPPASSRAHEPSILTADHLPATIEDVLAALPARPESDRLISIFFNARFMALPVIHAHQFRRQYDAFWRDPAAADMLWVSILFSLLAAAATISVVRSLPVTTVSAKSLLDMSGRCLAAGQYLLGARPHAVESLLLHTYVRSMQRDDGDADPSVWAMQGLAIRLAQRRGYHRDSAKVNPSLSFFEAEMRRRVWFLCSAFDCLWSFHQGTPPAVVDDVCDAGHPSCLTDDDFDEDTPSSPPPVERPHTDPLPILASHYKSRLCPIMRRIIWNALSVRHRPASGPGSALAAAMELSEELQAWHRSVPACLRFRPIRSTAFADAPHAIMHRIMLENLYRKCLCILHRPYLGSFSFSSPAATTGEKDGNGGTEAADIRNRSRRICREAAVGIMDIHIQVDAETHPGGRLYEDRFMISNLTLHDLLIAAMIICVDLHKSADIPAEDRAYRVSLLQTAHGMWSARTPRSQDAALAVGVLRTILNRVETPPPGTAPSSTSPAANTAAANTVASTGISAEEPEGENHGQETAPSDPSDRATTATGGAPPTPDVTAGLQAQAVFEASLGEDYTARVDYDVMPQLDSFFSSTEGLDWRFFDNYVLQNSDKMILDEITSETVP